MDRLLVALALGLPCFILPVRHLIALSFVGVGLADSRLVSYEVVYYLRFVPMGALCVRVLGDLGSKPLLRRNSHWMFKIWMPFWIFALISVTYSHMPSLSIQRVISAGFVFFGFGLGIPIYFGTGKKTARVLHLVGIVLGTGVLYSLYLAFQGATLSAGGEDYERLYGVFKNPNTLGLLAMQLIFILLYFYQEERRRFVGKWIFGAVVGAGVALVASGSRAAALGLSVGLVIFIWSSARIQKTCLPALWMVLIILVSIYLTIGFFFPEYSGSLFRPGTSSRSNLWARSWDLYVENSPWGVGFGGSDNLFGEVTADLKKLGIYAPGPHNSFLRILIEVGFVGLGLSCFAFGFLLYRAAKLLNYVEDPKLGGALLAVVVASLVNAIFEEWIFGFGNSATVPFWLFLAMLSHLTDKAHMRREYQTRISAGFRPIRLAGGWGTNG